MRIVVYEHFSRPGARASRGAARTILRAGRAMRDAVSRDLASVPGTRLVPLRPGPPRRVLDRALARADAALVIAPEDGGLLERLAGAPARAGVLSLGPGPRAVRLGADKIATGRLLRAAGVPVPAAGRKRAGAIVFKPRRGCGAEGVVVVRRPEDRRRGARIAARAARGDGIVAQAFVAGTALSASYLVRAGGDGERVGDLLCLGLGCQHLSGRFRLAYTGGEIPGRLPPQAAAMVEEAARAAVAALARAAGDLRGFVGVDLVLGEAGPVVIEINPRLTSSYLGLSRMAGGRIARFMIGAARGERLPARLRSSGRWRFHASGPVRRLA
ncbi:MAG TPA: ATP-grasp domain-containing protein [Candidatus Polarisedimenticolia bacterium]|nr:ATP-grasp domain-containing protein [Candidatus Polarisedimenticolia bacterium]